MILRGDCLEALAAMDPDSIDAIVTDPPTGSGRRHSAKTKADALEMIEAGATVRETGETLNVKPATVRYWIRKARL